MRKEKKTLIMVSVRAPTIVEHRKTEAIQQKIFNEIVEPFKCDTNVHCARSKFDKRVLVYYIFKEGLLKNSMKARLEKKLGEMQFRWPSMIRSEIMTIDADVARKKHGA